MCGLTADGCTGLLRILPCLYLSPLHCLYITCTSQVHSRIHKLDQQERERQQMMAEQANALGMKQVQRFEICVEFLYTYFSWIAVTRFYLPTAAPWSQAASADESAEEEEEEEEEESNEHQPSHERRGLFR